MLNFTGYVCAVRSGVSTFGEGAGPVWLYNLACRYSDRHLDDCLNNNLQTGTICSHSRDAAVICQGLCHTLYVMMHAYSIIVHVYQSVAIRIKPYGMCNTGNGNGVCIIIPTSVLTLHNYVVSKFCTYM